MSGEMPDLQLWHSANAYFREESGQVRLNITSFAKHPEGSYSDSTKVSETDTIFTSLESFAEFVAKMNYKLEELKLEAKKLAEVA